MSQILQLEENPPTNLLWSRLMSSLFTICLGDVPQSIWSVDPLAVGSQNLMLQSQDPVANTKDMSWCYKQIENLQMVEEPLSETSRTSYHKDLNDLQKANTELKDHLAQKDHSMKKQLLVQSDQLQTELQFEKKKCSEFQSKWKEGLKSSDDTSVLKNLCSELNNGLNSKSHELSEMKKKDFERKKRIGELQEELKRLLEANSNSKTLAEQHKNLKSDLERIKETAVNALMDKDTVIAQLEDKLSAFDNIDAGGNYMIELSEYKEKYIELEEKYEQVCKQHDYVDYQNKVEIGELKERLDVMKVRNQERSAILEQDIVQYQKYIEELKAQRSEETILTKSLDDIQDKYRRSQKRVYDLQTQLDDLRAEKENENKKLDLEVQTLRTKLEEARMYESSLNSTEKELEKYRLRSQKELDDLKSQAEKLVQTNRESMSKILELEAQKARLTEELQEYKKQTSTTLAMNQQLKEHFSQLKEKHAELENWSPENCSTMTLLEQMGVSEFQQGQTLGSALQDRIKQLEEQLDLKTTQNQQLRSNILQLSETKITDESRNAIVQLQDYRQHINKLENNILIIKLRYAQDQSFWVQRQKSDRSEFQSKLGKAIKEKGELYEKLQKLRKSKGDKKGVYVSALR